MANACQTMLTHDTVIRQLARENMSLAETVADALEEIAGTIRAAFESVNTEEGAIFAPVRAVMDEIDAIAERWADAVSEAVENYNAERTVYGEKNTAPEGGKAKYQQFDQNEIHAIQGIGRKSVNQFTAGDIQATEQLARRYWAEMSTKSPFFRAWFGDWRARDQSTVQIAGENGNTRGKQHNADTGWDINISGMVFNETKNHRSSFTVAAQPYLPYINDIVKKAVLLDTSSVGKAKSPNSLLMHSFYAVADIGNGEEVIKLYVEEMNDPNSEQTGKRAYQLQNIEKYQTARGGSQKTASLRSAVSGTALTVSDLFAYVKQKDSAFQPKPVSEVLLNADGTPKVFYHGTASDFWTFDRKKATDKTGRLLGLGAGKNKFYLTEYEAGAKMAASGAASRTRGGNERVLPLYVQASKVLDRSDYRAMLEKAYKKYQNSRPGTVGYDYTQRDKAIAEVDRAIQKQGYDAVMDTESGELFVYRNTQIKSATDNIGTFDSENPDIRWQRFDATDDDTATEAQGRRAAYDRLQNENAVLRETVAAVRKLITKQGKTIEALQNKLRLTKTPETRLGDARKRIFSVDLHGKI